MHCHTCADCKPLDSRLCDKPSPYQHLLEAQSLSDEAHSVQLQFKDYVRQLRLELYDTEGRIAHLRQALERAQVDRKAILHKINTHTVLLSPINDLPPEILSHIFSFVFTPPFTLVGTGNEGPLLLRKVCHRWKQVACNTPSLWSSVSFSFDFNAGESGKKWSKITNALAYCGPPLPLTFAIAPFRERGNLLSDLASMYGPRLKELRFEFPDWDQLHVFQSLARLETLELSYFPQSGPRPTFNVPMPRLRHFTLQSSFMDSQTNALFILPWAQLTSLHIRMARSSVVRHVIGFLSPCQNLVALEVSAVGLADTEGLVLTLPHLRDLHTSSLLLIAHLTCPVLQTFGFKFYPNNDYQPETVRDFVTRSRCQIQELCVVLQSEPPSFSNDSSPSLAELLLPLSTVDSLQIDCIHSKYPFDKDLETLLRVEPSSGFPSVQWQSLTIKLHALDLQSDAHRERTLESVMLELFRRRRAVDNGSKFRSLRLVLHRLVRTYDHYSYRLHNQHLTDNFAASHLYRGLKELEKDGLKVDVRIVTV